MRMIVRKVNGKGTIILLDVKRIDISPVEVSIYRSEFLKTTILNVSRMGKYDYSPELEEKSREISEKFYMVDIYVGENNDGSLDGTFLLKKEDVDKILNVVKDIKDDTVIEIEDYFEVVKEELEEIERKGRN